MKKFSVSLVVLFSLLSLSTAHAAQPAQDREAVTACEKKAVALVESQIVERAAHLFNDNEEIARDCFLAARYYITGTASGIEYSAGTIGITAKASNQLLCGAELNDWVTIIPGSGTQEGDCSVE